MSDLYCNDDYNSVHRVAARAYTEVERQKAIANERIEHEKIKLERDRIELEKQKIRAEKENKLEIARLENVQKMEKNKEERQVELKRIEKEEFEFKIKCLLDEGDSFENAMIKISNHSERESAVAKKEKEIRNKKEKLEDKFAKKERELEDSFTKKKVELEDSFTKKEQMLKEEIRKLNISGEDLLFLVWMFIFFVGFLIYNK